MESIHANAICTTCGSTRMETKHFGCVNGHNVVDGVSNWLELQDSDRSPDVWAKTMEFFNVTSDDLKYSIITGVDLPVPGSEVKGESLDDTSPKMVIYINDGIVQWAYHNIPDLVVTVLDGDTEGADEADLIPIEFLNVKKEVYCYQGEVERFDPKIVNGFVSQLP